MKHGKTEAQIKDEKSFKDVTESLARMLMIFQKMMQSAHIYSNQF